MRFGFELRKLPLKFESLTKERESVGPVLCKAANNNNVLYSSQREIKAVVPDRTTKNISE